MIRFSNATKLYPGAAEPALKGVSLKLAKSEFAFLTGPSGSGKSTMLKLGYMEELPTSGSVQVGAFNSETVSRRDIPMLRRRLGIVFQDFRLLEDRTAEQNVAFALEVTGVARSTIAPKVARALAQVGLASKGRALPHQLSGGEQQRVAIARALVNDPFLLIADEPTGNLDERAARGVMQLLREVNAVGTAVLMATHDLELVERSGHRTVHLEGGTVVSDSGSPSSRALASVG